MKLTLDNFRCYRHKEIEFSKGVWHLRGPSGRGKSTLFEGVAWVLYGRRVKGVSPLSSPNVRTKGSVQWLDILVTRQTRPNLLTLVEKDVSSVGEVAQERINALLGSQEVFLASSYLVQNKSCLLLTEQSLSQMRLLNKFAFNSEDPSDFMGRLEEALKEEKVKFITVSATHDERLSNYVRLRERASISSFIEGLDGDLREKFALWRETLSEKESSLSSLIKAEETKYLLERQLEMVSYDEERHRVVESELMATTKEVERLSQVLSFLKAYPLDMSMKEVSSLMEEYNLTTPTILNLSEEEIGLLMSQESLHRETEEQKRVVSEELSALETVDPSLLRDAQGYEAGRHLLTLSNLEDYPVDIPRAIKSSKSSKLLKEKYGVSFSEARDLLESMKASLKLSRYKSVSSKLNHRDDDPRINKEMLLGGTRVVCPHCDAKSVFRGGQLFKKTYKGKFDPLYVKEVLADRVVRAKMEEVLEGESLETLQGRCGKKFKDLSERTLLEIEVALENRSDDVFGVEELLFVQKYRDSPVRDPSLREKVLSEALKLQGLEDRLRYLRGIKTTETASRRLEIWRSGQKWIPIRELVPVWHLRSLFSGESLDSVKEALSHLKEKERLLSIEKTSLGEKQRQHQAIKRQLENLSVPPRGRLEEEIEELRESLSHEAEIETLESRHHLREIEEVKRLQESNLKGIIFLKEKAIEVQGRALRELMDSLCRMVNNILKEIFEDPISVHLESVGKNLDLTIRQKGLVYEGIEELSGGEWPRLSLAFFIALNNLSNSPVVFIDESMRSFSSEQREIIYNYLNIILKDRIVILVNHDPITGEEMSSIEL